MPTNESSCISLRNGWRVTKHVPHDSSLFIDDFFLSLAYFEAYLKIDLWIDYKRKQKVYKIYIH